MATSLLVDFISMSDRQLGEYAKMLKVCGFTGIQVTDMVSAWRASGSWEIVHDRYKVPPKARYRELNSAMESRKAYNTL